MEEFSTLNSIYQKYAKLNKKFITQHDTTRKYIVFKSLEMYLTLRKDYIYLHEVIPADRPRKFFVDLDGKDLDTDQCEESTKSIIDIIINMFAKVYHTILMPADIIVVDSSGESDGKYKFSKNIIIDNYAMKDYAEFRWFGEQVYKIYYSQFNSIQHFLDLNFFNRQYTDSYISARLPGCTKTGEARFKNVISGQDIEHAIISYTSYCQSLPCKSEINRDAYREKYRNKKNINIDDVDVMNILNATKHIWENAFQVRSSTINDENISISFDRLKPSYCTFCTDTHHSDNTLIIYKNQYGVYYRCRQSSSAASCIITSSDNIIVERKPIVRKENKGSTELVYDAMFPKDKNLYLIKAEMKMGKTKRCIEYIEKEQPKVVILLSFRRTFSVEMRAKYKGFVLYSDIKEKQIYTTVYPKIIIQVESLHRLIPPSELDLFILDEVESIWSQFSSGNLVDYYGITSIFTYLLRNAAKIIAMDAHLNARTDRLLKYVRPKYDIEVNAYINTYNPSYDYTYYIVNKTMLYCMMFHHLSDNKKIIIMTNSLKESTELYDLVKSKYPEAKIGLYNSRTKESKKIRHFSNVHQYWTQYDCVICSPTVSAGISYELEHFDYVFGSFNGLSCNVETCRQMLCRVRNIKSKTIYLSIHSMKRENDLYPCDPETIKLHLKKNRAKLLADAKGYGIEVLNFEVTINGDLEFYESFPYQLVSENIAFDNRSKNNFRGVFMKYLHDIGSDIKYVSIPEQLNITTDQYEWMQGAMTENTENVQCKKLTNIHTAENITEEQYVAIKDRIRSAQDITRQESFAMDKYKIRVSTCIDNPDENIVSTFMSTNNIKQLNMCKSLLGKTREEDIKSGYSAMQKKVMSGALLDDAITKYKSVTNKLFIELFTLLPISLRVHELFIGTSLLTYSYSFAGQWDSSDIAIYWDAYIENIRKTLNDLLMSAHMSIPVHALDKDEIFDYFKDILKSIYGVTILGMKCHGHKHIIFEYNKKYYKAGKIYTDDISKFPVILIKE